MTRPHATTILACSNPNCPAAGRRTHVALTREDAGWWPTYDAICHDCGDDLIPLNEARDLLEHDRRAA